MGDAAPALEDVDAVIAGLTRLGYDDNSVELARAHRIRGEILLRDGRTAEASAELLALVTRLGTAADAPQLELGQALDLQGCALRESGNPAAAVAAHDSARARLEKLLPANHPFLIRNTLYREAATDRRDDFARDAAIAMRTFEDSSIWSRVIDAQLHPVKCAATGFRHCVFLL
jgi:hypothetical protein